MELHIDLAVLLAILIYVRIQRRVQARSRGDQYLTVAIVLVFGLLVAPTPFGQGVLDIVTQVVNSNH